VEAPQYFLGMDVRDGVVQRRGQVQQDRATAEHGRAHHRQRAAVAQRVEDQQRQAGGRQQQAKAVADAVGDLLAGGRWTTGFAGTPWTVHARANTRLALVPPKPKLLDITVARRASRLSRRIGKPSARGSSASMLAEPAMKPPCIISRL